MNTTYQPTTILNPAFLRPFPLDPLVPFNLLPRAEQTAVVLSWFAAHPDSTAQQLRYATEMTSWNAMYFLRTLREAGKLERVRRENLAHGDTSKYTYRIKS
jgi:hypothetical protein